MKYYSLLSCLLLFLVLTSCEDGNTFGDDFSLDAFYVSSKSLSFYPIASSQTIEIQSNGKLQTSSSESWCTATLSSDGKSLVISVEENISSYPREAYITVKSANNKYAVTIQIIQSGVQFSLDSSTNDLLNFNGSASSKSIKIRTNISYTVSSSESWCTAIPSSDYRTLTITVEENKGTEMRTAIITLTHPSSGKSLNIRVSQSSLSYLGDQIVFTLTNNGKTVSFMMKLVESGSFMMGATLFGYTVHQVNITNNYYIGETEVTQGLWYAVTGLSPTTDHNWFSIELGDDYAAYFISYFDANDFLTQLNTLLESQLPSGMKFRMPTEAEWEYAAKGGNKTQGYKYAGGDNIDDVAWYTGNSLSSFGFLIHPVKQKKPNELGLYDMSGNVEEWCYDWYGDYPAEEQTDPQGPATGTYRVYRGSCSAGPETNCRVDCRGYWYPSENNSNNGFRLALGF